MKNSPNKILIIVAAFLLLTNIGLVVFMLLGKDGHDGKRGGRGGDPFEMMSKELSLTEQQQKDLKQRKEEFFKNNKPLFDSLRGAKAAFFALIKDPNTSDSLIDVYNHRISERQEAIDKLTFSHFKRVRASLTPEQQPKFDTFVQKMMQRNRKDSAAKKDN